MKKITESQKELIALAEVTIKKENLKSLTQSAKIVLGDIILLSGTDFAKNNGYCYRTNLDLVKDCELNEKTVIKSVRLLEANNIILSKRGIRGKASEYSVNPSMSSEKSSMSSENIVDNQTVSQNDNSMSSKTQSMSSKTQSMSSEMSSKSLAEIKDYIDMKFNELKQFIVEYTVMMSSKMSSEMSSKTQSMSSTESDIESDKDIDKDSYIVNSNESIRDKKENKNNINNTLIRVKESDGKTIEMESNNEIINNFSFVDDESTVNEIDDNVSTEIVLNESTIDPNNVIGVAAVQQPQKLSNIYFSFSDDRENNSISSTNDGKNNIISMGDSNIDSMTSTEVQEERDSNNNSISSTKDNKDEIGHHPQNLLDNNPPKKAPHFLPNETENNEDFKRSIYQRLVYNPSQTNEQIEDLYNDIVKLRDSNEIPQNEMDLIIYGFKDKVKYISALRDKCKL